MKLWNISVAAASWLAQCWLNKPHWRWRTFENSAEVTAQLRTENSGLARCYWRSLDKNLAGEAEGRRGGGEARNALNVGVENKFLLGANIKHGAVVLSRSYNMSLSPTGIWLSQHGPLSDQTSSPATVNRNICGAAGMMKYHSLPTSTAVFQPSSWIFHKLRTTNYKLYGEPDQLRLRLGFQNTPLNSTLNTLISSDSD